MNAIIRSDLNYFSMNGIKPNFFDKNSQNRNILLRFYALLLTFFII